MKIIFLIMILSGVPDWAEVSTPTISHYKFYRNFHQKIDIWKWRGYPDPNYVWEDDILAWERTIQDIYGNEIRIKTYKQPYEIIANFNIDSKIYGVDNQGKIKRAVTSKFGGSLIGFVWVDNISGGGEVMLPFMAPHIFIATGDRLDPNLTEIFTDPNEDNYYKSFEGKTYVYVKTFSGIGGAAGAPPTLIAHYRMNDDLDTDVIIDETGSYNGAVKDATGTATSAFHSVVGKIIKAQNFDGTDDYVITGDHFNFTTEDFSFVTTIKFNNLGSGVVTMIIWGSVNSGSNTWIGFQKDPTNDYLKFVVDDNIVKEEAVSSLTPVIGTWYFLVGTKNSNGISFYIDGILVATDDSVGSLSQSVGFRKVSLGSGLKDEPLVAQEFFNGIIENVVIFSVELTPDEVKRLYNNGHGTEILAEIDSVIIPRRSNTSPLGTRVRYEFP